MKKIKEKILEALFLLPAAASAQATNCSLTIKLNTLNPSAKAYLVTSYGWTNQHIIDSSKVQNNMFMFNENVHEMPIKADVIIDHSGNGLNRLGNSADLLNIYLEKGYINITAQDSVKYAIIKGSELNTQYTEYKKEVSVPVEDTLNIMQAKYRAMTNEEKKSSATQNYINTTLANAKRLNDSLKYVYIKTHLTSYMSLVALKELVEKDIDNIDVYTIKPIFESLSQNIRNSKEGIQFLKQLNAVGPTAIGAIAPDFKEMDVNGNLVSLSSFKGKYILLDFWASWCGPCRGENPNVAKAYKEYGNKNFTVLSVSLDSKKDAWLAAIKADSLNWTHLSDLKGWQNQVALLYNIKSIPQNFLIDPTGKIIGKNLRGDALESKLGKVLK